jgi:hypothetical protein
VCVRREICVGNIDPLLDARRSLVVKGGERRSAELLVDVPIDRTRLVEHESVIVEHGYFAEWMQSEMLR